MKTPDLIKRSIKSFKMPCVVLMEDAIKDLDKVTETTHTILGDQGKGKVLSKSKVKSDLG